MAGNPEAYAALRSKLENLPENVVVIASHAQMDNRKEKVRSDVVECWFCLRISVFDGIPYYPVSPGGSSLYKVWKQPNSTT